MRTVGLITRPVLCAFLLGATALLSCASHAQTSVRVRGAITAFDGKVMAVKSREGKDLKLQVSENTRISAAKAITLGDLKSGDVVGATTVRDRDGNMIAREVHTLSATSNQGQQPWDLEPGSTMTNAAIAKTVKSASGHDLTLEFKGTSQTIRVPDGTPIVTSIPGDRSLLLPGVYVVVSTDVNADGSMTARSIQASKDGVRPPQ